MIVAESGPYERHVIALVFRVLNLELEVDGGLWVGVVAQVGLELILTLFCDWSWSPMKRL
jgi:hypothetical protein